MDIQKKRTKLIYLIITLLLVAVPLLAFGISACVNGKDKKGSNENAANGAYNYYVSAYENLTDYDNVFTSLTYGGLIELLDSPDGLYLILFGGAHNEATQEVIPYINAEAKKYGAQEIFIFDFKLDGGVGGADIDADLSSNPIFKDAYGAVTDKLKPYNNTEKVFNGAYPKIPSPTLIAYSKNVNAEKPVFALVDDAPKKGTLGDAAKRESYVAKLDAFFEKAALGLRGNGTGKVDTADFDYLCTVDLLNLSDVCKNNLFAVVTYAELIDMLENKNGGFVLFIGGVWSGSTGGMLRYANEVGKTNSADKIYFFDTRLDNSVRSSYADIKKANGAYASLYVKLVSYFGGFKSKWNDKLFDASAVETLNINGKEVVNIAEAAIIVYDKSVAASFEAEYAYTEEEEDFEYKALISGLTLVFKEYRKRYVVEVPAPSASGGGTTTAEENPTTTPADDIC